MDHKDVPYIIVESMLTRMERTIKRLWIALLIVIALCAGVIFTWIYYENQFQTTEITQDVDTGDGDNTTVIGIGDSYGKD